MREECQPALPGDGILSAVIWPSHAGACDEQGNEPISNPDYQRGQLSWGLDESGRLTGHCRILVPAGTWCFTIYSHHPTKPVIINAQKLSPPMILPKAGWIDLDNITEEDIRPLNPDPVLHD
jgi:hypothetical protein